MLQGMLTNRFQMFDFGEEALNLLNYNASSPPVYDLSQIPADFHIALFHGSLDYLADPDDVSRLINELPVGAVVFDSLQLSYAHLDYTWGYNANKLVYRDAVRLLKEYAKRN